MDLPRLRSAARLRRDRTVHRCLLIHEIFAEIARNLVRDADKFHLAQVCRAFYETSMDELWRSPPTVLLKLISCLPRDTIYTAGESGSPTVFGKVEVLRTPAPHEWGRFKHHARRVKRLELGVTGDNIRDRAGLTQYLDALAGCFPGIPVLPNLKTLYVLPPFTCYIHLFLHPHLSDFIWPLCPSEPIQNVVSLLDRICAPSLRSLALCHRGPAPKLQPPTLSSYESLLFSCRSLVCLHTAVPLHFGTVAELPAASSLVRLEIRAPFLEDPEATRSPTRSISGPTQFANLQMLDMLCTVRDIMRYLQGTSMPALHHIKLSCNAVTDRTNATTTIHPVSGGDVAELMALLPSLPSLQRLHIFLPWARSATLLPGSALLPLTSMRNLTEINLHRLHVNLQPGDIKAMALAWPRLRYLCLGAWAEVRLNFQPSICVEDLHPFARHCPSLGFLAVVVAGCERTVDTADVAPHQLEVLAIGPSIIHAAEDQDRIIRFLSAVFPRVDVVMGDQKTAHGVVAARLRAREARGAD
ncbi:hypothetical protein PsYK624_112280 [Phanerochaete sordida]|uniref:F-box domain-containing protein n=1 Tax=Phanerochaete sordida TaxID=48140 RepID=A0A9P3LHW3_9APHY|nr:hypothetical protein PsYK624_112280 [Phanerochaete sordida]